MRILVVEDNAGLAALLAERLGTRGLECDIAASISAASDLACRVNYDAVLLDLGLPDGDGLSWVRTLGDRRPPILVLTARGTTPERIAGLDAGADDYLVKPADADEITARLRALMRRPGMRQAVTLQHQSLAFDTASRQATYAGTDLNLGVKEAQILEILMRQAGKVVPRERLENALYGVAEAVTPNALEAVVSRLRKRIAEASGTELLHAIRGVGYYLGEKKR
jgi:two-component system response regulator QseB